MGRLSWPTLMAVFITSAILGDAVNYAIGSKLGRWAIDKGMVKKEFIEKTEKWVRWMEPPTWVSCASGSRYQIIPNIQRIQPFSVRFYDKYGGKTVVLARFVPIIRTFAPFVAGVGSMSYSK